MDPHSPCLVAGIAVAGAAYYLWIHRAQRQRQRQPQAQPSALTLPVAEPAPTQAPPPSTPAKREPQTPQQNEHSATAAAPPKTLEELEREFINFARGIAKDVPGVDKQVQSRLKSWVTQAVHLATDDIVREAKALLKEGAGRDEEGEEGGEGGWIAGSLNGGTVGGVGEAWMEVAEEEQAWFRCVGMA